MNDDVGRPSVECGRPFEDADIHVRIDFAEPEPVSTTLARAIAAAKDVDPLDLDPLYESIDPDALDRLFDPERGTFGVSPDLRVGFSVSEFDVTVDGSGHVVVEGATKLADRQPRTSPDFDRHELRDEVSE